MAIRVRAASHLRHHMPGGQPSITMDWPAGGKVVDLLEQLQLPSWSVWIVRVNGEIAQHDDIISDNDSIELFPLVGGG